MSKISIKHLKEYNRQTTDEMKLKGKVRQLKMQVYKAFANENEIVKGDINFDIVYGCNLILTFHKDGWRQVHEVLNSKADYSKSIFDKNNKAIESFSDNHNYCKSHHYYYYYEDGTMKENIGESEYHFNKSKPPTISTSKTTHTYDTHRKVSTVQHFNDSELRDTTYYLRDENGFDTEHYFVDKEGKRTTWTRYINNPKGGHLEMQYLNPDGTIREVHDWRKYYDKDYNWVNKEKDPYEEDSKHLTETFEYDEQNNWVKKVLYFKKKPLLVFEREFIYYNQDKPELRFDNSLFIPEPHKRTFEYGLEEIYPQKINQNINQHGFTIDQSLWLCDFDENEFTFSPLRFYALKFKEHPSVSVNNNDNVEINTLVLTLIEQHDAYVVHNDFYGRGKNERTPQEITIAFKNLPYVLHIDGISENDTDYYSHSATLIDTLEELDENYDEYYSFFLTGTIRLLMPSEGSGKRDRDFEIDFESLLDDFKLEQEAEQPSISMVQVSDNSFTLNRYQIKDQFHIRNLDINYGKGFTQFHNDLVNKFNTETKGLVLFHGLPGTGKTYYIRHLLREMAKSGKTVIYMPPNMVDYLVDPGFLSFISRTVSQFAASNKFCCLLIEDAEPLLAARQQEGERIQGVTNLLNLTDGILNDLLKLQIICTFNVDLKEVDKALLRPGRLIARKEFKPISMIDANILAQSLKIDYNFKNPVTISEIYSKMKNQDILIH